ncbi:MAG: hypothetical protein AAF485_02050 [Chloroflexota bacterium]
MPVEKCPIKGYEELVLTFPGEDELTVEDYQRYAVGARQARDMFNEPAVFVERLFGSLAVCTKVEGVGDIEANKLPLKVMSWVVQVVYISHVEKALMPSMDFLSTSPPTPAET